MEVMQSAVRLPTPDPEYIAPPSSTKRKRSPPSRSPSPRRRRSPPRRESLSASPERHHPVPNNDHREHIDVRQHQLDLRFKQLEQQNKKTVESKPLTAEEKQAAAKAEYEKLLNMRSGGTYIPPAKLRALQAEITDKTSKEYQRMAWEALKKSINGLINKVNTSNIKHIVPELFGENLVRGRGLFCRSIMKAQAASLPFTPIYAAMAAIVNTKLPQVGELLVNRLIIQFLKAFKRNDKAVCLSSTNFIAQLVNQQVAHEMLAAEILLLLLHKPTDDSVEIAVGLTREVGQHLEEMNGPIALLVFDQFRGILHEAKIDKRTQYMIEVLFQVRKDRYKDNPAIKDELDLVEEEDQITHRPSLQDDSITTEDGLNIFKFDPDWQENEDAYKKLKAEILGEADDSDDGEEYETDESEEDEEAKEEKALEIKDQSNTNLVNLRRTIYLTIKSSGSFEEACHKLMKIHLPGGQEPELPSMIIECASQERTYDKFYGLIGERFCKLNRLWSDLFENAFATYYDTIHRYETNRLRIIAQFFGHLLSSDAIGWHVMSVIRMNQNDTTSSSRIFIKILFEELAQAMSMKNLTERMRDETLQTSFEGIFPKDDTQKTRFSINFFTAIGMGAITEDMREYLKNIPKPEPSALPTLPESDSESVSSYSSYSSDSSRSRSPLRSMSRDAPRRRDRKASLSKSPSRSPPRRRGRSPTRSFSRSVTPPRRKGAQRRSNYSSSRSKSRRRSASRTPPPRRSRQYSLSRSPTPRRSRSRSPYRARNTQNGRRPPPDSRSPSRSPVRKRHSNGKHPDRRPSPPPRFKERSLSPYSKRVLLTRGGPPPRPAVPPPRQAARQEDRRRYSTSRSRSPKPRRSRGSPSFSRDSVGPGRRKNSGGYR
ncbi:MA3-domain-containing protein [Patellaria atrata CBS 101060]|uniref:Pre-mRNA-splicing factor CWC22 n=1 Tax=Patellaria atrata CBS 101060 TaxID=1346257 RepID=A0A9P4VNK4_9PEZI|nr:MA3-domain-containing protein [Patellaria atrata CBS 101060]